MENNYLLFLKTYYYMYKLGDLDPYVWMLNYLKKRLELNQEQVLWLCFLWGLTYQLPSAYFIWNEFPDLEFLGLRWFEKWWKENYKSIPVQRDKLKQRPYGFETVKSYKQLVGNSQIKFFENYLSDNPYENFAKVLQLKIRYFGRFSIWNWTQALKHVAGLPISPPPELMKLGEYDNHSVTLGLCKAFGMDLGIKPKELKKLSDNDKQYLQVRYLGLIDDLKNLDENVDGFKTETVACAFKKFFRTYYSRYVGYYLDRFAEDVKKLDSSSVFSGVDWRIFWEARRELLKPFINNDGIDKSKFAWSPERKCEWVEEYDELLKDSFYEYFEKINAKSVQFS